MSSSRFATLLLAGVSVLMFADYAPKLAAAPPAPSSEGVPHLMRDVVMARRISGDDPVYPETAKMGRMDGEVIMHVIIGPKGRIVSVETTSSTSPFFTNAVTVALQTWRFTPATWQQKPVYADATVKAKFLIKNLPVAHANLNMLYNFAFEPAN
jgi:TonB family protein